MRRTPVSVPKSRRASTKRVRVKKYLPYLMAALGVMFIVISILLRQGTADAEIVITNVTSSFMLFAGVICLLVGLVTFFLRDDPNVW